MRVVFDSFQSYIMETLQPALIPNPMPSPSTSTPNPAVLHDEEDQDSTVSQSNLDALLTAINSNSDSTRTDSFLVDSHTPNAMSIQSLLASSESSPQQQQQPGYNQVKRKLEEVDTGDARSKIRKTVKEHLVMDHSRIMSMTTVVCLHAAVAQKSYGSEKRFLCPPPIVRIEGPNQQLRSQQLTMRIVSEDGRHSPPQKATLDTSMQAAFKHLHVGGSPKQKNFHLSLDIATAPPPTEENRDPPGRVWASFESAPVTIISKPSKKTAKTRNISSCILPGGPVSLFNRINSQTVRTKYMMIDHASLCASNTSWSAFSVNVVYRPPEPQSHLSGPQTVTYGSQIVLTDTLSGISTGSLIIRKVDKGVVTLEDGGPVSQMQKIALQRLSPDGSRQYLSAAGTISAAGSGSSQTVPAPSQNGTHALTFQSPRSREEVKDGIRRVVDEVDDYLCWTIVGISKFQYTFFDALHKIPRTPAIPLTPFPTLFTPPIYRQAANTLELTVSNFYSKVSDGSESQPLEVWLGSVGPLKQRVYQSNAAGPLTSITTFQPQQGHPHETASLPPASPRSPLESGDATQSVTTPISPTHSIPPSSITQSSNLGPLHSIVVVEMPKVEVIINAILDILEPDGANSSASKSRQSASERNGKHTSSKGDIEQSGSRARQSSISEVRSPVALAQRPPSSLSAVNGCSLPILFVRPSDGMGYHSGRSIVCENIFQNMTFNPTTNASGSNVDPGWIANAQQALSGESGYASVWSLRVL